MLIRLAAAVMTLALCVPAGSQESNPPTPPAQATPPAPAAVITVASDCALPPWADGICAVDTVKAGAGGPSAPTTVYVGPGVYQNNPPSDFEVYNPTGPAVDFSRLYRTSLAANGKCSAGFSAGWTHSYDNTIFADRDKTKGNMWFAWYNGANDPLVPKVKDGQLTGELVGPKGPYFVFGKFGKTPGSWESITVTFRDEEKWVFLPDPRTPDHYRLSQISQLVGKPITLSYDASGRLEKITQYDAKRLLTLAYGQDGLISTITSYDGNGKGAIQRKYAFGQSAGSTNLLAVSQLGQPTQVHWSYNYTPVGGKPFLAAVGVPSPTGKGGLSVAYVTYDANGRVSAIIDANSNQHCYTYGDGQTKVEVKNPSGKVEGSWIQKVGK